MKLGIHMLATDSSIRPDELAREVEARGFESLWFGDHSYVPVEIHTGPDEGQPKSHARAEYRSCIDPLISIAMAVGVTRHLKLATGVCLMTERDPLNTAKMVATLDCLSGGRIIFGVGAGWHAGEIANHGVDFRARYKVLRERVLLMRQLWTNDQTEFAGEHVKVSRVWCLPRPAQRPHPPVIAGVEGPTSMERMIEWADGWAATERSLSDLPKQVAKLHELLRRVGRAPSDFPMTILPQNGFLRTSISEAEMAQFKELGFDRVVLNIAPGNREHVVPLLDEYALLAH
jgi:probable F420-dependent oxidoreductase